MTTIPGHNIVIQQSGRAHDATHHMKPTQPDPQHLQTEQVLQETVEQTTVQSTEESNSLRTDDNAKKREQEERKRASAKRKKREAKGRKDKGELGSPGHLLDTVA